MTAPSRQGRGNAQGPQMSDPPMVINVQFPHPGCPQVVLAR